MSDEIVTEEESLRARLRQEEVEGARLAAEKARIEKLLGADTSSRVWLVGVAISLVVAGLGFGASSVMGARRAARLRLLQEERAQAELVEEERKLDDCRHAELVARLALSECAARRPLGRSPSNPLDPSPPTRTPPCNCQAGDPLCSCL
jgi:hypothetical protein